MLLTYLSFSLFLCGKSPGGDGLITEFYKKFWDDIGPLYLNMINETYKKGELPYTMRKAILALLFKKGDKTLLKNYRPISLTNYDYKILCFVLANAALHYIVFTKCEAYLPCGTNQNNQDNTHGMALYHSLISTCLCNPVTRNSSW